MMDTLKIREEGEENNIETADKMKSMAVIGFIGAVPITNCFMTILSICHPSRTKHGTIKTIHPSVLEQFLRKFIRVFT